MVEHKCFFIFAFGFVRRDLKKFEPIGYNFGDTVT